MLNIQGILINFCDELAILYESSHDYNTAVVAAINLGDQSGMKNCNSFYLKKVLKNEIDICNKLISTRL